MFQHQLLSQVPLKTHHATKYLHVKFAIDPSGTNTSSKTTNEHTQARNPLNVRNAINASHAITIWKRTCAYIQAKNPTLAHIATANLSRWQICDDTCAYTQVNVPTLVTFATHASATRTNWKHIPSHILARNLSVAIDAMLVTAENTSLTVTNVIVTTVVVLQSLQVPSHQWWVQTCTCLMLSRNLVKTH